MNNLKWENVESTDSIIEIVQIGKYYTIRIYTPVPDKFDVLEQNVILSREGIEKLNKLITNILGEGK